jgi:hypothetical protein
LLAPLALLLLLFVAILGEVMTFNTLRVTTSTDPKALSKAIIARLALNSHTVMECYGTQALAGAVQVSNLLQNLLQISQVA